MAIPIRKLTSSLELLKDHGVASRLLRLPTTAEPACVADRQEVVVGERITLSCAGFQTGDTVKVWWDKAAGQPIRKDVIGLRGTGTLVVPTRGRSEGNHHLIVKSVASDVRIALPVHIAPVFSVDASTVKSGDRVEFAISGLTCEERIEIVLTSQAEHVTIPLLALSATPMGTLSGRITIPPVTPGEHLLRVRRDRAKFPPATLNVIA